MRSGRSALAGLFGTQAALLIAVAIGLISADRSTFNYSVALETVPLVIGLLAIVWFYNRRIARVLTIRTNRILDIQHRRQRLHEALRSVMTSRCIQTGGLDASLNEITEIACHALRADRVSIWELSVDEREFRCFDLFVRARRDHANGKTVTIAETPHFFNAIRSRRVLAVDDVAISGYYDELPHLRTLDVKSMIDAPIYVHGKLWGMICIGMVGTTRRWKLDEQDFVASIADSIALSVEISKRKKLESNLQRTSRAIESAGDGIAILDDAGQYVYMNAAHAKVYGYDNPDELIGKTWKILYDDSERSRFESEILPKFKEVGNVFVEAKGRRKDGTIFPQEVSLTTVDGGGFICVCRDLTLRKEAEEYAEKMRAVAQLAGGIAHDFNNILTGIFGHVGILKATLTDSPSLLRSADSIEGLATRAGQLTKRLLLFARQEKKQNIRVDLHDVIRESVSVLSESIGSDVRILIACDAPSPFVDGDPVQLEQVVVNLVQNARDSMLSAGGSYRGTLSVRTKSCAIQANDHIAGLIGQSPLSPGPYVKFSVEDTGCGIPPEILGRIFEPFFTTKGEGKGSGIGLSVVHGIVASHGGGISVESTLGKGSTFSIYLPYAKKLAAEEIKPELEKIESQKKKTILVVDDNEEIRSVLGQMLSALGYRVIGAEDGVCAVNQFKATSGVDLVILDMSMPNLNGRECFHALRAIDPDVKAILSTAYLRNGSVQEILDEGIIGFVQKPYQLSTLASVVSEVLGIENSKNHPPIVYSH